MPCDCVVDKEVRGGKRPYTYHPLACSDAGDLCYCYTASEQGSGGGMLCLCTLHTCISLPPSGTLTVGLAFTCSRGLQGRPGVRHDLVQTCSRRRLSTHLMHQKTPWHFQLLSGSWSLPLVSPMPGSQWYIAVSTVNMSLLSVPQGQVGSVWIGSRVRTLLYRHRYMGLVPALVYTHLQPPLL